MRKLKLQMQITLDGFVAGPNGELDWIELDDDKLREFVDYLAGTCDTILMGRKMTNEFVNYWTDAVKRPEDPWHSLAKKMVDYPKIVFTKTLDKSRWPNTVLAKGNIVDEVNRLKNQKGKDIIAYGGAEFASSLIKHNLIDEYYFYINPVAIGNGLTIFKDVGPRFNLKQLDVTPYPSGVTLHKYLPAKTKAASSA
jgi:dihydrofolate reductase